MFLQHKSMRETFIRFLKLSDFTMRFCFMSGRHFFLFLIGLKILLILGIEKLLRISDAH